MALKYEGKNLRRVHKHLRKIKGRRVKVRDYWQRYNKPRGDMGKIKVSGGTKTAWLKDKYGQFIGRANSRGQTSAPRERIRKAMYDNTKNIRESSYGRIYGRTESRRR